MKLLLLVVLLSSCKEREPVTWQGVEPSKVTCDFEGNGDTRRLCVGDGQAYICVREPGGRHWECAPVRSLGELEQP